MHDEKSYLRKAFREQYAHIDTRTYVSSACTLLENCEQLVHARHVLAYVPITALEIPCIEALIQAYPNKTWYVPEIVSEDEMIFATHGGTLYTHKPLTCVLVPSLALREDGARLGKGKGYYDKFLAAHSALIPNTVSVVPNFAHIDASFTTESHDVYIAHPLFAVASL